MHDLPYVSSALGYISISCDAQANSDATMGLPSADGAVYLISDSNILLASLRLDHMLIIFFELVRPHRG